MTSIARCVICDVRARASGNNARYNAITELS